MVNSTWGKRPDGTIWEIRTDFGREMIRYIQDTNHPRLLIYLAEGNKLVELPASPFNKPIVQIPAQQRFNAYQTEACIEHDEMMLTCDQAMLIVRAYQLEVKSDKAKIIKDKWLEARAAIRAKYPDSIE